MTEKREKKTFVLREAYSWGLCRQNENDDEKLKPH
jgi:hypothetical protein